ncbi:hypothetical protein FHL15_008097 [Xylaria flabelliformis]|uniref:Uncharacterized protein n=1 Tax=Xylaria flabelliformis TaxID=2512241 RepID=A0A553HSF8_9PEZI|nr:hypothetical protein FHL15_008097 [Xylaria flabelliformis]
MRSSKDNQVKEGKKTAEKKVTEKRISKTSKSSLKRGQPTAAARLISSPYIKFGWHRPLSGEIKEMVQRLGPTADSMYMLQTDQDRPIDSLSLRNGIFWEHRKLHDASIVATPALDHIDLFPFCDELFEETLGKIGKRRSDDNEGLLLHYLFEPLRSREFLVLPIQIEGTWVTIITRMGPKLELDSDLEVTDLAIIDPVLNDNASRRELICRRLVSILAEGCIQLPTTATVRDIMVTNLACNQSHLSGLVAYAVSREFLRRLKVLQYRRSCADGPSEDEDFLWENFEERYNLDAYRQDLTSACAYQTIEASDYQVRLALEVPSDDANYQPSLLRPQNVRSYRDERWEIFQSPTHTLTVNGIRLSAQAPSFTSPSYTSKSEYICRLRPNTPACSPTSLQPNILSPANSLNYSPASPLESNTPVYNPTSPSFSTSPSFNPTSVNDHCPSSPARSPTGTDHQVAPVAPMEPLELSTQIPKWNALNSPESPESLAGSQSESQPQETSRKRQCSVEDEDDVKAPPEKRQKTEDNAQDA